MVDLLPGHPCRAVLTREQGGWTGPQTHRSCGVTDDAKPAVFRGEWWCSENHRKLVEAQKPPRRDDLDYKAEWIRRGEQLADVISENMELKDAIARVERICSAWEVFPQGRTTWHNAAGVLRLRALPGCEQPLGLRDTMALATMRPPLTESVAITGESGDDAAYPC